MAVKQNSKTISNDTDFLEEDGNLVSSLAEGLDSCENTMEVAGCVLESILAHQNWTYGSVWTLDRERELLVFEREAGETTQGFQKATHAMEYHRGLGLAGRAWEVEDVVFIADLADSDCARATPAKRARMKSAVCIPVIENGEVVGAVDFVEKGFREPAPQRMNFYKEIAGMISERVKEFAAPAAAKSTSDGEIVSKAELADLRGQIQAIRATQAVIEFDTEGIIQEANDLFLKALGYKLEEIVGKHHRIFVDEEEAESEEYSHFWEKLANGELQQAEFMRITKSGDEIWIYASYTPIRDAHGEVFKVVKYATDITAQKLRNADFEGQLEAINANQAVIEFEPDGTIKDANGNFLSCLGYGLDDIVGGHHRMFVDPSYASSLEYRTFWEELADGKAHSGEFLRYGRGGREIWISASYTPIRDMRGRVFKIVKYATDITREKNEAEERLRREREEAEELAAKVDSVLGSVEHFASGDLTAEVHVVGEDPIGRVGKALRDFVEGLRGNISTVTENAVTVASASEELSACSSQMAAAAEESHLHSSSAMSSAEAVNHNIQTVAQATGEMAESISDIANNANQAAQVASRAVEVANTTNQTIEKLGDSSIEIGNVIKVITTIAQQTNLLALNATIEAARAGDAGRGFAVVANEVKELAKETAKATEDISQRIEAIQADSEGAVRAIHEITSIIDEVSGIADSIASAVEEQSATTNEMSRNVSEVAVASSEIMTAVGMVAESAESSSSGASESLKAAEELAGLATGLQKMMSRFTV